MNKKSEQLIQILKELHLSEIRKSFERIAKQAEQDSLTFEEFLLDLMSREQEARRTNRIERFKRESKLIVGKTMDSFDLKIFKPKLIQQVKHLLDGSFIKRNENIIAFGNPGSGKTHLLNAICDELINSGIRSYFTTCEELIQDLLISKRDLKLSKHLKRLDKFEIVLLDDIGYVQQNREQMEVLFSFLAHRYERRPVMVTSNLPFSQWEKIFKDPMTTAAAIDRLVHHSVILDMNGPSYRVKKSKEN